MTALSKINQTLNTTSHQLDYFAKELKQHPEVLKTDRIEKLTNELTHAATEVAKEIKEEKAPSFKADSLKSQLSIVGKLIKNESLNTEFKAALKSYASQLKALKKLKAPGETTKNREVKVKPVIRRDSDVGKHLTAVSAKLKVVLTNKDKVKAQHFKELTNILMKTNVALAKSVAFHKTMPNQYKPNYNARMIQSLLNGMNALGSQARIAQVSSQAAILATFNMTLTEAKGLLEQVLEHLKESRGKRVSKVSSDRAKK
jgi:hypothetical protein